MKLWGRFVVTLRQGEAMSGVSAGFQLALRLLVVACAFVATSSRADDASSEEFFEKRIRPVLAGTCFRCHGGQKTSGGLRIDSREGLTKGGESGAAIELTALDQSLLLKAIRRADDASAMPPDAPYPRRKSPISRLGCRPARPGRNGRRASQVRLIGRFSRCILSSFRPFATNPGCGRRSIGSCSRPWKRRDGSHRRPRIAERCCVA